MLSEKEQYTYTNSKEPNSFERCGITDLGEPGFAGFCAASVSAATTAARPVPSLRTPRTCETALQDCRIIGRHPYEVPPKLLVVGVRV